MLNFFRKRNINTTKGKNITEYSNELNNMPYPLYKLSIKFKPLSEHQIRLSIHEPLPRAICNHT